MGTSTMVQEQLRSFVISNFYVADPATLSNAESLLDSGVMDSTGVLEVIAFIEETFDIVVEDTEMLPENLDSVDNIASYILRKRK
jgi:acyl carrier protein